MGENATKQALMTARYVGCALRSMLRRTASGAKPLDRQLLPVVQRSLKRQFNYNRDMQCAVLAPKKEKSEQQKNTARCGHEMSKEAPRI